MSEENTRAKYAGLRKADGSPIPGGEPYWVLRAKDTFTVTTLIAYRTLAVASGLPEEFIADIDAHMERVGRWQAKHGVKLPDGLAIEQPAAAGTGDGQQDDVARLSRVIADARDYLAAGDAGRAHHLLADTVAGIPRDVTDAVHAAHEDAAQ